MGARMIFDQNIGFNDSKMEISDFFPFISKSNGHFVDFERN